MSTARELWETVYRCAESGRVKPETMIGFFFEALNEVLNEAETVARAGDTATAGDRLRELQARCERLLYLIEPGHKAQSLQLVR